MKEHPILFSTEMVKAILDERKTMTRRVVKPQPTIYTSGSNISSLNWKQKPTETIVQVGSHSLKPIYQTMLKYCPYGQVGDRLWVRETHYQYGYWIPTPGKTKTGKQVWSFLALKKEVIFDKPSTGYAVYKTDKAWHKRPSIFMPRWASRIDKMIKLLKFERLLDISKIDALAEGFNSVDEFLVYWDKLNKKRGYGVDTNPWNWAIGW